MRAGDYPAVLVKSKTLLDSPRIDIDVVIEDAGEQKCYAFKRTFSKIDPNSSADLLPSGLDYEIEVSL